MKKVFLLAFMLATPAAAQENYCPEPEIPYTFTMFEDVLLINRAYHRAFCQQVDGPRYECLEKWPGDTNPSVYTVRAERLETGELSFSPPLSAENEDPMVVPKCE
ncbi:hypothetical protein CHH27_11625 [Labrenzia sp. VG12]|nr:hypothetical protein CHH27_11625 [Labrenzia sp. VG12]